MIPSRPGFLLTVLLAALTGIGPALASAESSAISSTGENVTFHSGDTIEVPLVLTTSDNLQPRTITFPGLVTEWPRGIAVDDLQVQPLRNTLTLWLKNPGWSGTIQVGDDTGAVYRLRVRHAGEGETPDPSLTVTLASEASLDAGVGDSRTSYPSDPDSGLVILERAMSSRIIPDSITVAPVTSEGPDKKLLPYRVFPHDDLLETRLVRIWTAPTYKGYECQYVWHGESAVLLHYRRLKFPGGYERAINSPDERIIQGVGSVIVMRPGVPVTVNHICLP